MKKPKVDASSSAARFRRLEEVDLTPGAILTIADQIRAGGHDPVLARRLLQLFVDCAGPNRVALPEPLLQFLRERFREYLRDPRPSSLERLLGLRPASHRIATMQERDVEIAMDVLQRMLRRQPREAAFADAGEKVSKSRDQVKKIWERRKQEALFLEKSRRGQEGRVPVFTAAEGKLLRRIFPRTLFGDDELKQADKPRRKAAPR